MKRFFCAILTLCLLAFCGCAGLPDAPSVATTDATAGGTTAPKETTLPTETAEQTEPAPTEPEITTPLHADTYVEGVSLEQMTEYFEEVVLNIEYTQSQTGILRKWTEPITYRIIGEATQEDVTVLTDLFAQLNEVPGFPGISLAEVGAFPSVTLNFLNREDLRRNFADVVNYEEVDGAVQFWFYNATNNIYNGRIGYCTEIDQSTRNSVLVEEVINLLGISDTTLREDSIVYQYGSEITQLSEVDWAILKLLYDPAMECGMDRETCAAVLETLYY